MPLRFEAILLALGLLAFACSGSDDGGSKGPAAVTETVAAPAEAASPTTPGASTSSTPQAPAGTSLTPRVGASTDIATARRLESEGDFEAASEAYVAIAAQPGPNRGEATLSAARVLLELERPADVRLLLEPFVPTATGRDVAARYLLARAYAALRLWDKSLEQYDAYVAAGRPALPYAYLDRARDLVELSRPADAIASLQKGLALGVPAAAKRSFLLAIAQDNELAGNLVEAVRGYNALIDASDAAGDQALALSRIAAIKRTQGDPTYTVELRRLLAGYPSTTQALTDLEDAVGRGEAVDPTVRGLIYYRHNDYTRAEPFFHAQIADAPNAAASAEAWYYVGAIVESRGRYDDARDAYARAASLNPDSSIADDALWWQARLLEDDGERDDAQALYERIVDEYPRSTWAADAAFRDGMLAYGAKEYSRAALAWEAALQTSPESESARLHFWQGKAYLKAGNDQAAKAILQNLATHQEDDYYGIRARALLDGKSDQPDATRESKLDLAPKFDWTAAEAWLAQRTGRAVSDAVWSGDYRWARAQELWLVGRNVQGDTEAFDLMQAYASDAGAMYTLSRTLLAQGRVGMSGRAGQRLMRVLDANPNEGLPKALLSLSYPAAFGTFAQRYATAEKISPLLLLAFVRQESFFDPRAESPAGALGLTQLLPDTAEALASKLGAGEVDTEDLLAADLNLKLGARYMADQLSSFDGEIFVAFAAYNAGPNAAKRWRASAGEDADVFLETIEFKESRLYVELVSENYAIYRYLYAAEDAPDLP